MPQNDNAVIGEKYVELAIHNCPRRVFYQGIGKRAQLLNCS